MAEIPTPGEIAYTAYWPALGIAPPVPWAGLSPVVHTAWEAAAEAVRAMQDMGDAAPERATVRQQQWSRAMHLLTEQIRELPHEPDIASELEEVWVMLHTLREAEAPPC